MVSEPHAPRQVEVALERLAGMAPDLHELLSQLDHRLNPVLRGSEDEPNPNQPASSPVAVVRVALAEAIDIQATSVYHATLILQDILQRLEL